jgi:hypothetical protein
MKYSLVIQALLYSNVSNAIMLRNPPGSNSPSFMLAQADGDATTAPAATEPEAKTPAPTAPAATEPTLPAATEPLAPAALEPTTPAATDPTAPATTAPTDPIASALEPVTPAPVAPLAPATEPLTPAADAAPTAPAESADSTSKSIDGVTRKDSKISGDTSNAKTETAAPASTTPAAGSTSSEAVPSVPTATVGEGSSEPPAVPKQTESKSSTVPLESRPTAESVKISGFNGADEDDIMDKVIKKLAVVGRDSTNNKTGQLFLSKEKTRRAGEIILEATHKVKQEDVPQWMDKYFEDTWTHYDQNKEGFLRYEESHTFMRYLMNNKNKFVGAPGSITDMTTGGAAYKIKEDALEPKPKAAPKATTPKVEANELTE